MRVLTETAGPVATVTLDRPERHNALVPEFLDQLRGALAAVSADPAVRAVVLGARGRSFSTGGDIAGFAEHFDDLAGYADGLVRRLNRVILDMISMPQPVVAAVHGLVTGGSMGLVLAADLVVVGPNASFAPWYGEVGFTPDGAWTALLPRVIGHQRTMDLLGTNRIMSAAEALRWGVASRLVDHGAELAEALEAAAQIASEIGVSATRAKSLLRSDVAEIALALDRERVTFVSNITRPEVADGIRRFLDR